MSATVLLYEREASLRKVVAASLRQIGLRILEAGHARDVWKVLETERPDLFILELDRTTGEDCALIEAYREQDGGGAVILTTMQRPSDGWRKRYQPEAVIYKPYDVRFLCNRIRSLIPVGIHSSNTQGARSDVVQD